jgi:Kef-type K+ transport system membrane component KefB
MEQAELFRAVVDICVLIIVAEVAASLNARLRLPRILGTLLTGTLFGPYLIGGVIIGGRPFIEYSELIYIFSEIGAVLLLYEAGLHMRFSELLRAGKASLTIAGVGVIVPYCLGFAASILLGYDLYVGMIIGGALTATSIAISLKSMEEMGQLNSPEAKLIIGAAVIDDVLALSIASVILSMIADPQPMSPFTVIRLILTTLLVWFLMSAFSSRLVPWIAGLMMRLQNIDAAEGNIIPIFAILTCFGFAGVSGILGLSPLVGAFVAGMAIADSKYRDEVASFTGKIGVLFVPLFFVVMGAGVNPYSILTGNFLLILILGVVAVISKLVGCGLPAMHFLKDRERGLRVGYGMISRGEIGLVISSIGITYGILSDEVYTALVIVIFVTTLLPPFMLRRSYLKELSPVSPDPANFPLPEALYDLEGSLKASGGPESRPLQEDVRKDRGGGEAGAQLVDDASMDVICDDPEAEKARRRNNAYEGE